MTLLAPSMALVKREILRFIRQRSRVTGALAQPIVFWILLGGGLNASFRPAGAPEGLSYVQYFYPGTLAMVLLFTAIFATISTVEDRKTGFLQGVLVAPVGRWEIVLGQCLGGTVLAVLQAGLCLALAPFIGVPLSLKALAATMAIILPLGMALNSLGLIIAWRMDSTQGFHAIMNLILLPLWLLSGALFPMSGAPAPLSWVMMINPMTYGLAALRRCLYLEAPELAGPVPELLPSVVITLLFCVITFVAAVATAERKQV